MKKLILAFFVSLIFSSCISVKVVGEYVYDGLVPEENICVLKIPQYFSVMVIKYDIHVLFTFQNIFFIYKYNFSNKNIPLFVLNIFSLMFFIECSSIPSSKIFTRKSASTSI